MAQLLWADSQDLGSFYVPAPREVTTASASCAPAPVSRDSNDQ